ncbi:hypothetical protein [Glycomyces buryatensis]|uniref:Restriction endonuclease type IV Mrr domain-containing protein n=1 Tax=Glycomyces buryatensis TaxID=2570927 RepID=A0A4S8PYL8_9ACTN|nr:hypothetical protein [Glycomyces buryatensis]THV35215.1 hypothetical protein FAB82_23410 [Glycomyces buryatensis]
MRISSYYELGRTQSSLEFVDVDTYKDTQLFLDPHALRWVDSEWGNQCVSLLQSFFSAVLDAIQQENHQLAQQLLASMSEPNETRLGLSKGRARGRGMGRDLAREMWEALRKSRAVSTGLLEDLEDTILFIEGIGFDIISDITTNIIRGSLIEFTQDACRYYNIPMEEDVGSGRIWNHHSRTWMHQYVSLSVTSDGPLLLVPKSIVRRSTSFEPGEYYTHYVLPVLQEEELRASSLLVQTLKNGDRKVTKKSVREKYGEGKVINLDTTIKDPSILDRYRKSKARPQLPPSHEEIASATETPMPDWESLLERVLSVPPGKDNANTYHLAIEALLSALFYPALDLPQREFNIHEGRKRIDIQYTNRATEGFFHWVRVQHETPAAFIAVECKNYGSEISNPEIDQLAMRFSPMRGQVGLLCHRGFGDKSRIIRKCRDAAQDHHGFAIALDDKDIKILVESRINGIDGIMFRHLVERFQELL